VGIQIPNHPWSRKIYAIYYKPNSCFTLGSRSVVKKVNNSSGFTYLISAISWGSLGWVIGFGKFSKQN